MGTFDVKLVSLIWRILLKHTVKVDRVVRFSAVVMQLLMLPVHAWGQLSGPSTL
jgi:hypothetical protein